MYKFQHHYNKHCGLPVSYLGNRVCQFVQEVKYLGVIIHSTMKPTVICRALTKHSILQVFQNAVFCIIHILCQKILVENCLQNTFFVVDQNTPSNFSCRIRQSKHFIQR